MSLLDFVILLIIAALAGAVGQAIVGFSRGGCLAAIAVGFVGAYLGLWIARTFNLPTFLVINVGGQSFPIIWAIIGSAILAGILSLFFGYRRPYRRA